MKTSAAPSKNGTPSNSSADARCRGFCDARSHAADVLGQSGMVFRSEASAAGRAEGIAAELVPSPAEPGNRYSARRRTTPPRFPSERRGRSWRCACVAGILRRRGSRRLRRIGEIDHVALGGVQQCRRPRSGAGRSRITPCSGSVGTDTVAAVGLCGRLELPGPVKSPGQTGTVDTVAAVGTTSTAADGRRGARPTIRR